LNAGFFRRRPVPNKNPIEHKNGLPLGRLDASGPNPTLAKLVLPSSSVARLPEPFARQLL